MGFIKKYPKIKKKNIKTTNKIVFLLRYLFKLLKSLLFKIELTILVAEFFITLFYKQYRAKNKEFYNERFFTKIK